MRSILHQILQIGAVACPTTSRCCATLSLIHMTLALETRVQRISLWVQVKPTLVPGGGAMIYFLRSNKDGRSSFDVGPRSYCNNLLPKSCVCCLCFWPFLYALYRHMSISIRAKLRLQFSDIVSALGDMGPMSNFSLVQSMRALATSS